MISNFFVISPRGDTIIAKEYRNDRGDVGAHERSHTEAFFRKLKFWDDADLGNEVVEGEREEEGQKGDAPPVIVMPDGLGYFHVKRNGLIFGCSSARNVSPTTIVDVSEFNDSKTWIIQLSWGGGACTLFAFLLSMPWPALLCGVHDRCFLWFLSFLGRDCTYNVFLTMCPSFSLCLSLFLAIVVFVVIICLFGVVIASSGMVTHCFHMFKHMYALAALDDCQSFQGLLRDAIGGGDPKELYPFV